jgi:hypothetical protein
MFGKSSRRMSHIVYRVRSNALWLSDKHRELERHWLLEWLLDWLLDAYSFVT